ncbi:MAG: geranylgeranyl reductase family protein [Phormidesmis sp.]
MVECVIVGGGPAGSSAAYHLAKAGREVLLLEKAALPRYKPCSGAVSPSIAGWFDCDFTPAVDSYIRNVRYTWKLGDAVNAQLETEPIWSVRRDVFDQFLIDQAVAKGAQVRDQTAVTGIEFMGDRWRVTTEQETLSAQYLIGADGAQGPMANWLGFKPHTVREAGVLEMATDVPVENGAFSFEFGLVKNGCLWSFPKRKGYSIGASSFIGGSVKDFKTPLSQYVSTLGMSLEQGRLYIHPLKLWDGNRVLHTDHALLVGEAAAIVDPLTAEGIRPAIYSGMMAAQAINQTLNKSGTAAGADALANYTRIIHESWGADMQWAQRIANVFFRVPKLGYRVGIKRPTATKRLGQILAGDIRYADIAKRVVKRLSTGFIPGMGG